MKKILEKIKNNKIEVIFISIVLIIIVILSADFDSDPKEISIENKTESKKEEPKKDEKVTVDIKGAVKNPGVYEASNSARVIDIINLAGGMLENADTSKINLSKKITDEMVIIIYTKEEIAENEKTCPPCECPLENNACTTEDTKDNVFADNTTKDNLKTEVNTNKKISINTANIEELQTLDGIGKAKAEAIIGYRTKNGLFKKNRGNSKCKWYWRSVICQNQR